MRMRRDGVPVLGFTWYSLIDQIDWDTQLGELNNHVNECGLYDLDRKPRPVAEAYKNSAEGVWSDYRRSLRRSTRTNRPARPA